MKFLSVSILAVFLSGAVLGEAFGSARDFGSLAGTYSQVVTVTTSIIATGTATVTIVNPTKHSGRTTVAIDGSVSANGNLVPLRTKLFLENRKIRTGSLLLGLQGVPVATRVGHLSERKGKFRMRLFSAEGATMDGESVSGRVTYVFQLVNGSLKIVGRGVVRIGEGVAQPILIVLEAPVTTP